MSNEITATKEIIEIMSVILPTAGLIAVSIISLAKQSIESKKISKLENKIRLLTEIPLAYKNGLWYDNNGLPFCHVCLAKNIKMPFEIINQKGNFTIPQPAPNRLICPLCRFEKDEPVLTKTAKNNIPPEIHQKSQTLPIS